jgi:hypothetical protein
VPLSSLSPPTSGVLNAVDEDNAADKGTQRDVFVEEMTVRIQSVLIDATSSMDAQLPRCEVGHDRFSTSLIPATMRLAQGCRTVRTFITER